MVVATGAISVLAVEALRAHQALLRVLEMEPARQRDLDDAEVAERWAGWHDSELTPAWEARDAAITPLLAHPEYESWCVKTWGDRVTCDSRVPLAWRPVAVAIAHGRHESS